MALRAHKRCLSRTSLDILDDDLVRAVVERLDVSYRYPLRLVSRRYCRLVTSGPINCALSISIVHWHIEHCPNLALYDVWFDAIRLGNVAVLEWLHNDQDGVARAWGDLDEVDSYWWGHAIVYSRMSCTTAAKYGHVHVLQWLCKYAPWFPLNVHDSALEAAKNGHDGVLEWLRSSRTAEFNESVFVAAIEARQLSVLEYLRSHDRTKDEFLMMYGALSGKLDVLQYLVDDGVPWAKDMCSMASGNDHLHVLEWLRSRDPPCPWDDDACFAAATQGHLSVLKWLRAQVPPCPWDEDTCLAAVVDDNVHVLEWLRSQDPPCPWNSAVIKTAISNRSWRCMDFATTHGCPSD